MIGPRCNVNQWLDFNFIRYYTKSNRLSKTCYGFMLGNIFNECNKLQKNVMLLHNGKKLPKVHMKSTFVINDRNVIVTQCLFSTTQGILPLKLVFHATTIFLTLNFICYT